MEIILNIAHLKFEKIPFTLELEEMVSLAVLTDKYGATKIVRPWIPSWTAHLKQYVKKPGFEQFLWIAWEFGMSEEFNRIAAGIVLQAGVTGDGTELVMDDKILHDRIPPGLIR